MAANIEKDIRTYLRTLATVTNYVGTGANARIYWMTAPDGSVTYPYITYFTVSANGELMFIGKRTADALIQVSVWHTHQQDGLDLANNVFNGLSAYYGTPGDKRIIYVSCNGPNGLRDPTHDNVFQYIVTAEVRYER